MKIAVVTEDGVTVHSHFGQAPFYVVFTIDCSQVVSTEQRVKPSHQHQGEHQEHGKGGDVHAQDMARVIADCSVVIARGMGQPAFLALQAAGIEPILTEHTKIDEAIQAFLRGDLAHRPERVHRKV